MSEYRAQLSWQRRPCEAFVDKRYSRAHELRFDGGAVLAGSSSPHSVPLPYSDASAVDPEEMFVAALSSCHMLWFLGLAAAQGLCVERYDDEAVGVMACDERGRMAMTEVVLRPRVELAADAQCSAEALAALHHQAHEECFIANSVRSLVRVEPQ